MYVKENDLDILGLHGWEAGMSGQSWFKKDKAGLEWQCYVVDGDRDVTFVPQDTRESINLTWKEYEELFV